MASLEVDGLWMFAASQTTWENGGHKRTATTPKHHLNKPYASRLASFDRSKLGSTQERQAGSHLVILVTSTAYPSSDASIAIRWIYVR